MEYIGDSKSPGFGLASSNLAAGTIKTRRKKNEREY
jgi:hypothetical protein